MKLYLANCERNWLLDETILSRYYPQRRNESADRGGGITPDMKLYIASPTISQIGPYIGGGQNENMKMYLAGEHDIKNGLARITGGGGKIYAYSNLSSMPGKINTSRSYIAGR